MDKKIIIKLKASFEEYAKKIDGIEFWFARDLQKLLNYDEWRNFQNAIEKAKIACNNSNQEVTDHFVDVNKKVKIGSEAEREIEDVMLTRYACYLIAQNGDPRKEEIAFAQSYFAVQTRKQELIEQRIALQVRLARIKTDIGFPVFSYGAKDCVRVWLETGWLKTNCCSIELRVPCRVDW